LFSNYRLVEGRRNSQNTPTKVRNRTGGDKCFLMKRRKFQRRVLAEKKSASPGLIRAIHKTKGGSGGNSDIKSLAKTTRSTEERDPQSPIEKVRMDISLLGGEKQVNPESRNLRGEDKSLTAKVE